jgi:hypothetical protein
MWTTQESLLVSTKQKITCTCKCGVTKLVRVNEILAGKSLSCRSCACRLKMAGVSKEDRLLRAKHASNIAAAVLAARVDPYKNKYGDIAVDNILAMAAGAKQRCTNPNAIGFSNYGGRGIKFKFPSIRAFTEWVLDNLGAKPGHLYSMDRIDNDGHYEAGNLRWATRGEQARNKRAYKRTKNGERIRVLHGHRPDLTYETLRLWITQGLTDDDILQRSKYARTSL